MDVDKLLQALENDQNSFLLDLTTKKMHKVTEKVLKDLHLPKETFKDYTNKLKQYHYIDDLSHLTHGSFIRCIPISDPDKIELKNGCLLCDIKVVDEGISLVCKGFGPYTRHFQIKFDEHLIFQKLTSQELVMLSAMDYLDNESDT
jgi:hypothetical protein